MLEDVFTLFAGVFFALIAHTVWETFWYRWYQSYSQHKAEVDLTPTPTSNPYAQVPYEDVARETYDSYGTMCHGSGKVALTDVADGKLSVWCGTCHRRFQGMQEAEINEERTHSVVPVHYN
jgi:hypothetical protein